MDMVRVYRSQHHVIVTGPPATGTFLEIPSIRLEFDDSESSKATEQLIAALDVSVQQPP